MFIKNGEAYELNLASIQETSSVLAEMDDAAINEKFKKFANQLKKIAPKAEDFLYFSTVMMHAAEASALDNQGNLKKKADGSTVSVSWDISPNGSWKWVSNDPSIKPYKNCFVPGTRILMADGSSKKIEEVSAGDMVISHTGDPCKVLRTFETPHDGKMLEIHARNGTSVTTTDNHPFYKLNLEGNKNARPRKLLSSGAYKDHSYDFVPAGELKKYDILLSPILKSRDFSEISEGQARLLGIFAAEGSYTKKYNKLQGLRFTFNIEEKETLVKFTKELFNKEFPFASIHIHEEPGNTCGLYATGYGIADFFYKNVGEYSLHKKLSKDLVFAPNNIKKQFILGWLEGDGCVESTYGVTIGVTASVDLATQARCMLNSMGILHSFRQVSNEDKPCVINGIESERSEYHYHIEIPFSSGKDLVKESNLLNFSKDHNGKNYAHSYENYAIHTITEIKEVNYSGPVYNFEVEKNNSYVANDLIVHNCNGDIFPEQELLKAYKKWVGKPLCIDHKSDSVDAIRGIILDTYYDRVHKRVIALCALDKVSYPELARGVETGYKTSVSMGTRVAKAICTDCGTVASVERDFCNHMKTKSSYGEINVGLDPIELSIVVNGADPQAKIRTILAHANNLKSELEHSQEELYSIEKDPHSSDSIKKLNSLENQLSSIGQELSELRLQLQDEASSSDFAGMAGKPSSDAVQTELNEEKFNLPERFAHNMPLVSELEDLVSTARQLLKENKNLSLKIKEEIMSVSNKGEMNKAAYFQGGGGVNEPAPHQVKYPKDGLNEAARAKDKHMVGQHDGQVGDVDGLHPGPDSVDMKELDRKKMLSRAELEERALRRAAALEQAKSKLAYFQGGGEGNEPTPGKKKYEVDPLNEKARTEDKHMVGQKPFPGVGDVNGLHPSPESADEADELERKKKLSRAGLKAKFVRAASPEGVQDKGSSAWQVFSDGSLVLTASVDEISGGNVEKLYDAIATEEFGKKLLAKVQSLGVSKTAALYKGAQAVAAPGAMPAAPADAGGAAPAPAMPEMSTAEPAPTGEMVKDEGGSGDAKETALELAEKANQLAEEMSTNVSDLLEAVRALTGEQSEMGAVDDFGSKKASSGIGFKDLFAMKSSINKALIAGMKKSIAELASHKEEMEMVAEVLADGAVADQTLALAEEAVVDGKSALADSYKLMGAFVKYARGSEQLVKQANEMKHEMRVEDELDAYHSDDDMSAMHAEDEMEELDASDEDENDVKVELPGGKGEVDVPVGATVKASVDAKAARAELRAKLAAQAIELDEVVEHSFDKSKDKLQLDGVGSDGLGHVETIEEKHDRMLDVAEAPVKVRKEAARLNKLISEGKVSVAQLDNLVAQGLDAEVVKYWKQFFGQAGKEGSEFATELLKEHVKAQMEEELKLHKVKLSRAYELANEMVRRSLLADDRVAIASQVDDIMTWNDEGFEAMKRVINKHALKKAASVPQVGLIGSGDPSANKQQEYSLQEMLDQAFSSRKY